MAGVCNADGMIGLVVVAVGLIWLAVIFPWIWIVYLIFIGMALLDRAS